jgi:ribonuclease P protein component
LNGNLIIKTGPSRQGGKAVSVLVGKNVFGSAVKRNLLKRRIRAILTPLVRGTGSKFIIIAKPSSASASFKEIKEEILNQIGKIKNDSTL